MADTDPLAEKMRLADRVTSSGDYYADMARAAREHIAAEVLKLRPVRRPSDQAVEADPLAFAQRAYYDAIVDAARIARGGTP